MIFIDILLLTATALKNRNLMNRKRINIKNVNSIRNQDAMDFEVFQCCGTFFVLYLTMRVDIRREKNKYGHNVFTYVPVSVYVCRYE